MLDENTFLKVVNSTPLVSIDLIIENDEGHYLLGLRNNRPAKGFWFVPGGRIFKNETKFEALRRIVKNELGISEDIFNQIASPTLLNVYEHFYEDCFAGSIGVTTHYVVLGYQLKLNLDNIQLVNDHQHEKFSWWAKQDILESNLVNRFTKDYFRS